MTTTRPKIDAETWTTSHINWPMIIKLLTNNSSQEIFNTAICSLDNNTGCGDALPKQLTHKHISKPH
uniref:Ovule protein n=1 Tax=Romanomermis culicivorax TaxID=13658 RepID=A0A915HRK3_ROMCU